MEFSHQKHVKLLCLCHDLQYREETVWGSPLYIEVNNDDDSVEDNWDDNQSHHKTACEWMCKQIVRRWEYTQTTPWFRPRQKKRGTIRSVACENNWREWPPFRWKTDVWCWQAARPSDIIWVTRLQYKRQGGWNSEYKRHAAVWIYRWVLK